MTEQKSSWWLRATEGVARRITPGGLLIGRFPSCDLVTRSPKVSRRQAMVYLDDGPRVAVMGRGLVRADGTDVEVDEPLGDGVTLEVGDLKLQIVREDATVEQRPTSTIWVLESADGSLFSFSRSPFRVGGSDEDDLRIAPWAAHALTFHTSDGLLEVEPGVDVQIDGEDVEAGAGVQLRRGSVLSIGGVSVKIVTGGDFGTGSTMAVESDSLPGASAVRLEFLPRGGRLHLRAGGEEQSVYLTDRRCDFIAVLLQPPSPLVAGEFVPDEQLWNRVWGKQPSGKKTLHVLLHRLRKDLARVGLNGAELLERAEGGGATRFVLREGARVALE